MKNKNKNTVISVENLSIGYQTKKELHIVADDIHFKIQKGSLNIILGKNGIGKSTLLRTISQVQKPLIGAVCIHDKNINTYSDEQLSTLLSVVLTERLPESQLTVFELVALGRQPYTNWIDTLSDKDLEKINFAIEQTEIAHIKHNYFYELSDGQLQRVLIARALAQDTDIIILDEPTAHLDLHHTIKIFTLLKDLVEKTDKTIIMSSHEVNLSIQLADFIILFTENKVLTGSSEELIQRNSFDNLFPKGIVKFNRKLQQFMIHKK